MSLAVSHTPNHRFHRLAAVQKRATRAETHRTWKEEWIRSTKGQHLRRIDPAAPGPHARKLYDRLPRHQASLLAQLRTGHNWLRSFRKRFSNSNDRCECGAAETIVHVFIDCPELREPRRQLREKIKDRFNSLTAILGGRDPEINGKRKNITAAEL